MSDDHKNLSMAAARCGIPPYMVEGLVTYVCDHRPPGDFLRAGLENDFMRAVGKADTVNQHRLPNYARFLYKHAPIGSYGSPEKVSKWLQRADVDDSSRLQALRKQHRDLEHAGDQESFFSCEMCATLDYRLSRMRNAEAEAKHATKQ